MNKGLQSLSLARKAGLLALGFLKSKEAIGKKKAFLIIVASDVSAKSEKEIRFFAKSEVEVLRIDSTMEELSGAIGFNAGIVAVCDNGFAGAIKKHYNI